MMHPRQYTLDGVQVPYSVRYSARARRVILRIISSSHLEIVIPVRSNVSDVEDLLREHGQWILRNLKGSRLPEFVTGSKLSFNGNELNIVVLPTRRSRIRVSRVGNELRVECPDRGSHLIRGALTRWYRKEAACVIPRRVEELALQRGVLVTGVAVRNQRTRWGSCSSKGTLNLNWRLILLPPQVMDYLICHELAHRKVMNHSAAFWRHVANLFPDYEHAERWLKSHEKAIPL